MMPKWLAQLIGSCVASGDFRTTVYRCVVQTMLLQQPVALVGDKISGSNNISFFAPYNYRAGRSIAGINGNSDGSLCMPHIKGKMQYGHLTCNASGLTSDAYPEPQDKRLYKQWGANDSLLNRFRDQAKCYLTESEPVKDGDFAHEAICKRFKPFNICSLWAFKSTNKPLGKGPDGKPIYLWTRNRRDQWAHNMSVVGCAVYKGRHYILIENSWGNFHDGNRIFAIELSEFAAWLRDAECQTVGNIDLEDNPSPYPET